jgi:hypothetical protein
VIGVGFVPIPILGPWVAAIRFMMDPVKLVREGMAKTTNGMFRIATLQGEYVLVTDREKVTEYIKAPDSVLNMQDGANDVHPLDVFVLWREYELLTTVRSNNNCRTPWATESRTGHITLR